MTTPMGWVVWRTLGQQAHGQHIYESEPAAEKARKHLQLQQSEVFEVRAVYVEAP